MEITHSECPDLINSSHEAFDILGSLPGCIESERSTVVWRCFPVLPAMTDVSPLIDLIGEDSVRDLTHEVVFWIFVIGFH
jgi:hypothetical protein